ncbi:hypothetical protein HA402_002011 [Bradysia odoriphaga]|nr:hypothetical protein HA402_002011 [Bradysia odoriphaga]
MRALIAFLAIFVLCFDLSNARANGDTSPHRTPSQIVMDSVPIADRPNFVAYHISIALHERSRDDVVFKPVLETIPPEKRAEFSRISTPPNFSTNLLDWTELELVPFKNGNQSIPDEFLGGKATPHGAEVMNVCFPNGCVDPNDAGYLCCPF